MTAYDGAEWTEFANTVGGGAAALAGGCSSGCR
jgi:hypothetical protein